LKPGPPDDGEPKPLHDWSSHISTAVEFWAVYKKTRAELLGKNLKMVTIGNGLGKKGQPARLYTPSVQANRATLYPYKGH
jgi:hypothetical protein